MEIRPEPRHRPIRMNVPLPLNWWEKIWDSKQEFLDASRGLRYPMMRTLIREDNGQVYPYAFVKGIEDEDLDRFPKDGVTPQFRIKNEDVLIGDEYKRKELFQVEYPGSDKETETLVDLAAYRNPTKDELDFRIRQIADTAIPSVVGGKLEVLQNNIDNVNSSLTSKINADIELLREILNNKITSLTNRVIILEGGTPVQLDTFKDWFLPSTDELEKILEVFIEGYENVTLPGSAVGLTYQSYLSSTQISSAKVGSLRMDNTWATNEHPRWSAHSTQFGLDDFNFSAFGAGVRINTGNFTGIGFAGFFWTSDEVDSTQAFYRLLENTSGEFGSYEGLKTLGYSVRIVRGLILGEEELDDGTIIEEVYEDIDGNKYDGVKIGDQVWTITNLRVTKYTDDTSIPTGLNNTDWGNATEGAYAIYNPTNIFEDDDPLGKTAEEKMVDAYGLLYNWHAVDGNDGDKDLVDITQDGFHIPSDAEWLELRDTLLDLDKYSPPISTFTVGNYLKSRKQVNSPLPRPQMGQLNKITNARVRPVRTFVSADNISIKEFGQSPNSVVFHKVDLGNGTWRYFEAAYRDLNQALVWGDIEVEGTSNLIGRGNLNTNTIVSTMDQFNETTPIQIVDTAAQMCKAMVMDTQGNITFE